MYWLRTFGGLGLDRDRMPVDGMVPQRKLLVLLATLAAHDSIGRERLMALFWPESERERARGSLKQALHTLRRQLSEPEIVLGSAELRLNADRISSDVRTFTEALARGDRQAAVEIYGGPFLDGVHLDGTLEFERWLDGQRERFAASHREALEWLATDATSRGDRPAAVGWWRRLQNADPLGGRAALGLVEALDANGDRAAALRHAAVHETLLRQELGISPDPAMVQLVQRLRAIAPPASDPPPQSIDAERHAPDDAPKSSESAGPVAASSTPAVGRSTVVVAAVMLLAVVFLAGMVLWNGPIGTRVAGVAGSSPRTPAPGNRVELASVAVLPFEDMSQAGDMEYLADGLAEEILTALAGIPQLRVSARTSSFYFKGRNLPAREIAELLGVDHLLEGSIRRTGDRVRITAQLIDAREDRHLWSRTFDPELDDVFGVQETIARTVANALRVEFTADTETVIRGSTGNPAAHDRYLLGHFHWNRRSAQDIMLAIRFFEEAAELDPGYARPWAGLALAYAIIPIGFTPPLPAAVARERLELAANRALELDPTLAEVHAARAISYHFEWRWADAEREFLRALELDPGYSTAHQWYGEHLAKTGRTAAGVAAMRRALQLDPFSLVIRNDLGMALFLDGQHDAARAAWLETIAMDPGFAIPHFFLHRLEILEGNLEAAEKAGRSWVGLTGAFPDGEITTLTRAIGRPDLVSEAMEILDRWEAGPAPRWLDIGFYRAQLGDTDGVFRALERGMDAREPMMAQIGTAPWLEHVRDDPRLATLVRQLGLAIRIGDGDSEARPYETRIADSLPLE